LKADPKLTQAAFKLTKDDPTSDPVETSDGFVILHLAGIEPARPLTFDEAKPKIVDQIKSQRARELATTKGRESAEKLKNALKSGKPLPAALQEAGNLKPEKIEPFTLIDESALKNPPDKPKNEPEEMIILKNVTSQLKPGESSDFVPWADGGFIAILEKRDPADQTKYQQAKAVFEERYLKNARTLVFSEWLSERGHAAGLEFPQSAKG
jgi:parvulin-like peptidyl-prolyl isomerase